MVSGALMSAENVGVRVGCYSTQCLLWTTEVYHGILEDTYVTSVVSAKYPWKFPITPPLLTPR